MRAIKPQRECPRWQRCSVNKCPLDPLQDQRNVYELDTEKKCQMEKQVRLRIGSKYPDLLPRLGLKAREWAGRMAFERLSPSVKVERLKKATDTISRLNRAKTGEKL